MKKYELTEEFITNAFGEKLYRIRALVDFDNVKAGEIGGYIEKEENLDQFGNAWVSGEARVFDEARVCGNARVCGEAEVSGNAWASGEAWVSDNAQVFGNAWVSGEARVFDEARVCGNARVCDEARVSGEAWVSDNARVFDNAWVSGEARVSGEAWVSDNARVFDEADYATAKGFGSRYRTTTFFRTKDGDIGVKCGCFCGTMDEFRKKVMETHGDSKTAKEYLMLATLMEYRFSKENGES